MNNTIESLLRFVNLTTSGLLAGSLRSGDPAPVPRMPHHPPPRGVLNEKYLPASWQFFASLVTGGPVRRGRRSAIEQAELQHV